MQDGETVNWNCMYGNEEEKEVIKNVEGMSLYASLYLSP